MVGHWGLLFTRESRGREVGKQQDKTNHTLFLFSLLLRLKLNSMLLSVFFATSQILFTSFKSKKKENENEKPKNKFKKKGKKKSWYEMRDGGKKVTTAHGIYSPNITPLMFPDME